MLKQYKQSTIDRIEKKVNESVRHCIILHEIKPLPTDILGNYMGEWVETEQRTAPNLTYQEILDSEYLYKASVAADGVDFAAANPKEHYNIPIYRFRTITDIQYGELSVFCPYCEKKNCFDLKELKDVLNVTLGGCECCGYDESLSIETKCKCCNKDLTYNIL